MSGQLVRFQPRPGQFPVCIGEMAPPDKIDDLDDDHVAVKHRGKVHAVPRVLVHPVGGGDAA